MTAIVPCGKKLIATVGQFQVEAVHNSQANAEILSTLSNVYAKSKGAVDFFGILSKGAALAAYVVPESILPWTSKVKTVFGEARNALAVPYLPTVIQKFRETKDPRDAIELAKIGSYSTAVITPQANISKALASAGAVFATALDGVDLYREVKNYSNVSDLSKAAKTSPSSQAARNAIDSHLWFTICRIVKFSGTLFAGIVATLALFLNVTIPVPLAIAALAASMVGIIFSFLADYSNHTAVWQNVKIRPLTA